MTTKTTKTVLFASLIAAMVIPLSGMGFAEAIDASNNNEKGINRVKQEPSSTQIPIQHERMNSLQRELRTSTDNIEKTNIKAEIQEIEDELVQWFETHTDKETKSKVLLKQDLLSNKLVADIEKFGKDQVFEELPFTGSDYDHIDNALEVFIEPTKLSSQDNQQDYFKKIRAIVGDEIDITLSPKEMDVPEGCASRTSNCTAPIPGGVQIGIHVTSSQSKVCTLGFAATYQSMTGFITAGHCADGLLTNDVDQKAGSSGNNIGTVEKETYWGNTKCDCAFIETTVSIDDGIYGLSDPSSTAAPFNGMSVTMSGQASALESGSVTSTNYTANYDGVIVKELIKASYDAVEGDSGAPVVYSTALVGIHSGGNEAGTESYFTETYWIEDYYGGLSWGF